MKRVVFAIAGLALAAASCSRPGDALLGAPWACAFEQMPDQDMLRVTLRFTGNGAATIQGRGRMQQPDGLHEMEGVITGGWQLVNDALIFSFEGGGITSSKLNGQSKSEAELRKENEIVPDLIKQVQATPSKGLRVVTLNERMLRLGGPMGILRCERP